jgi:thioredoxin reductase
MAPGRTLGRVLFYLDIGRTIVSFCFALIPAKVSSIVHRFTYRQVSNPKHVVVVGGSYAGAHLAMLLAESLPTGYDVVLVERNSHFNHTFAFPRFSVIGGQENKAFIPYDGIQKAAPAGMLSIIHDSVTSMDEEGHILLSSGRTIHYEYMAIATGAWQPAPARLRARSKDTACSELRRYQKGVAGAGRIAVLGGGAVGVEIAADIKSYFPEKAVTLIHSRAQVLNRFGPRLHEAVLEELERLGVRVVLGQRPSMSETATGFMDSCVELETQPGMAETFDLVVGSICSSWVLACCNRSLFRWLVRARFPTPAWSRPRGRIASLTKVTYTLYRHFRLPTRSLRTPLHSGTSPIRVEQRWQEPASCRLKSCSTISLASSVGILTG